MHKINNKSYANQPLMASLLSAQHTTASHVRSSLSLSSAQDKLQIYNSMCKSLKAKPVDGVPNAEDLGRDQPNLSMSKSKGGKVSDSYYYKLEKKSREPELSKNLGKPKDPKTLSHHRLANYKSKSKLQPHRKISKPKNELKLTSSNHQSLKQLISSTEFSQNMTKLQTVRTFSPELEFCSQQLSLKKKENRICKREEELLHRMEAVLDQYRKLLVKEQKEKEILAKENRRLREKLEIINSEKKYKNVLEYRL